MGRETIGVVIGESARAALFSPEAVAKLNTLGEVRWAAGSGNPSESDALMLLRGCGIGIGSWGTPWPSESVMGACPGLRLWVHAAGSVKHFFGPHLRSGSITIASCAPAIAESVAEMTLGLLIVGLKRVVDNARDNHRGAAAKPSWSMSLYGATIGVVGASTVGRRVIRNLQPFGARVLVYDPYLSGDEAASMGASKSEDLLLLCRQSHAITLHTPALHTTIRMFGAEQFRAMPDRAVFINTSRGQCVDEAALVAELQRARLTAFLDVSDPEPAAQDSPLRSLDNVIYTSHIAGGASWRIGDQVVSDVEAFLAGRKPLMPVTADQLDRLA